VTTIVDELDARRPHLVGLQKAFQFVAVELGSGSPEVVKVIDLLTEIEAQIAERGLPYEVVAVQENTSTGAALGLPITPTRILQFTDRVVALRRTDVAVSEADQGNYATTFPLGPLTLERGCIRLTTEHGGVPYHFVTTHLETQALAPLQAAQTSELINVVVAGLEGVTIVAGDLNSDPENPGAPSWTPTYDDMIDAGFSDAWEQGRHSRRNPGFTCCQDPNLRNGTSLLDQRIDFVLVRQSEPPSRSGKVRGSMKVEIVGEEQEDRTPTHGLWPADHAGLVAVLELPGEKSGRSGKSGKSGGSAH
jgi:endonuclease/exonuclease/phosphatase family metal-dependent hydrolase